MSATLWGAWGEEWAFEDKVSFDGPAKTITVHPLISDITTVDIYSAWVRWTSLYDNSKFTQALRTVGGDDIPGGQKTGLFVFLRNGWQIVIDHAVNVDGIIYHDDSGVSAFVIEPGGGVSNKVASLAYAYNTTGSGSTVDVTEIANAVWAKMLTGAQVAGSAGSMVQDTSARVSGSL